MNYEKKYKEALERAKELQENSNGMILKKWLWGVFLELKPSEDEQIKKDIISYLRNEKIVKRYISDIEVDKWIAWLEKQEQEPKKVSIWKHWKNGIAGNGEGKQIFLTKVGNTYNLSSVLSFECDYVELSELDNLMLEEQSKKKSDDEVLKIRQELYQSGYNDGYKHGQEDIVISLKKESIEALEHFVRGIGESGYTSSYDNRIKLVYALLGQLKQIVK